MKWTSRLSFSVSVPNVFHDMHTYVTDVPLPPGGPLNVNDVTKESATLKWKVPEDDGGSPITHYMVEKQEDNGRWVEVRANHIYFE